MLRAAMKWRVLPVHCDRFVWKQSLKVPLVLVAGTLAKNYTIAHLPLPLVSLTGLDMLLLEATRCCCLLGGRARGAAKPSLQASDNRRRRSVVECFSATITPSSSCTIPSCFGVVLSVR